MNTKIKSAVEIAKQFPSLKTNEKGNILYKEKDVIAIAEAYHAQFQSNASNIWVKARNFPHEDGFYCMRHHTINSLKEKFTSYDGKWFRNERWAYSVEIDLDNWEWLDEKPIAPINTNADESNNKIEVPVSEDAEQAIDELTKKIAELMKENTDLKIRIFNKTISNHLDFASNEFKKSIPGEDVEKAAEDFLNMFNGSPTEKELFKAGAEWQAKQQPVPINDESSLDAIEFAEWAYDNNWLIQSDKKWWNFQAELDKQVEIPTTELYEIYLQSLQLKK